MSLRKNQPERDEKYWSSLLGEVESIPSDQIDAATASEAPNMTYTQWGGRTPQSDNAWREAQEMYDAAEAINLTVLDFNKGGLLVEWHGIGGFIPASQIVDFPHIHLEEDRAYELRQHLGKQMRVCIIEIDPSKNRLIFSERTARVGHQERLTLWDKIRIGDRCEGVITNMTHFGAFVDLGGVEGLVHISELSWSRLSHPSDVISPGQHITCIVLEIDRPRERIALSLKRTRQDPWAGVTDRYQPGQMVEGVVNNVMQYGAFITLENELEGLVHITELAEGDFMHPRNVVERGDWVRARVISVDPRQRRIALTMRGL